MFDYSVAGYMDRMNTVLERIRFAATRAGRDPEAVKLVVVTKTHPIEKIWRVAQAGAFRFGENYADEAAPKIEAIDLKHVEWHMIGHIQSRKANLVSQYFNYVHSLDSLKLANRLSRFATQMNRTLPVLLECNASGEASKFGWDITQEERWQDLVAVFREITLLTNLQIDGLMTMAPYTEDPETVRPYFSKLRHFRDYLRERLPQSGWDELSMGMSSDFEVAIAEGATWVRIGQAIMGPRE